MCSPFFPRDQPNPFECGSPALNIHNLGQGLCVECLTNSLILHKLFFIFLRVLKITQIFLWVKSIEVLKKLSTGEPVLKKKKERNQAIHLSFQFYSGTLQVIILYYYRSSPGVKLRTTTHTRSNYSPLFKPATKSRLAPEKLSAPKLRVQRF